MEVLPVSEWISIWVLCLHPSAPCWVTDDSKLVVGLNTSMNACLCVITVTDWGPLQGAHHLLHSCSTPKWKIA